MLGDVSFFVYGSKLWNGLLGFPKWTQGIPTRDVSHCGLAIHIKKKYLKAKEELWKFNISPCMQKYNLKKKLL
jgi:hypothetical protein